MVIPDRIAVDLRGQCALWESWYFSSVLRSSYGYSPSCGFRLLERVVLPSSFEGALSYLMPVVIGGGPSVVRIGIAIIDWQFALRVALRNGALILRTISVLCCRSTTVLRLRWRDGWS